MLHVFDRLRPHLQLLLILSVAGCASPGRLDWSDGTDLLRTALVKITSEGSLHRASLLLSNGQLTCELPHNLHPSAQTQAYQALGAAICREGARHVTLDLYRDGGSAWEGVYHGVADERIGSIAPGERLATANYYGIDQAFLVDLPYLPRGYAVAADDLRMDMAHSGEVQILREGAHLVGEFVFPGGEVRGHFRATICEEDTSTIDWLYPTPAHSCP